MSKHNDLSTLAVDARALVAATADVAGQKVGEARERLSDALDNSRKFVGRVRDKAVEGARVTDEAVHEHPYHVIAMAFGAGALIGYLATRRRYRNGD